MNYERMELGTTHKTFSNCSNAPMSEKERTKIWIRKILKDLTTPPNRFDTIETFLKKMQDSEMRNNFLKAYNRRIEFNNR